MKLPTQPIKGEILHREDKLPLVLESLPVAVVITDRNGRVLSATTKLEAMFGYRQEELIGQPIEILIPERFRNVHGKLRAHYTENPRVRMMGAGPDLVGRHKDGSEFPVEVGLSHIDVSGEMQIIASITDITPRKQTNEILEWRVQERTQELSTLLEVSHNVASTLELESLLDLILDQLRTVVDYTESAIFILEDDELSLLTYQGPSRLQNALQMKLSQQELKAYPELFSLQKPVIIENTQDNSNLVQTFRHVFKDSEGSIFEHVQSWTWIPLIIKEQVIGALSLSHNEPNHYSPEKAQLILAFANQAVVAIENARLYSKVKQHSSQLEALFLVQQAITSRLDLQAILQLVADAARRLTAARLSVVYLRDGSDLRIAAISGEYGTNLHIGKRIPIIDSLIGTSLRASHPITIKDIQDYSRVDVDAIKQLGIRCYMAVPLVSIFDAIGVIAVGDEKPRRFDSEHEQMLTMLAASAVIGLENARLYLKEQERRKEAEQKRRVAESLRGMLTVLNSDRSVGEILNHIVSQASLILNAKASAVFRLYEETFAIQASQGLSSPAAVQLSEAMSTSFIHQKLLTGQPLVLSNLNDVSQLYSVQAKEELDRLLINGYQAFLAVPLTVKEETYGSLALYYNEPREFSDEEIGLAITFCEQATLAIENARLQAQVEEAAVIAERNRLARELHDAVTQSLFSASLIADIIPRLWDRDQGEGRKRIEELRQLTRGALAEMRTLLLELRPAALTEAQLSESLRHLVNAVNSRTQTIVSLEIQQTCFLPAEVKVGLYRITQEALNNVVKHARADEATVILQCNREQVTLIIQDNGRGFDIEKVPSEHLGLGIMHERAESVGAALKLQSKPEQGTTVEVVWPDPSERKNHARKK